MDSLTPLEEGGMTLPEELVTAVVEALRLYGCDASCGDSSHRFENARIAVAAVLRALPECEAVVRAGGFALLRQLGASHPDLDHSLAILRDETRVALGGIAHLGDEVVR